MSKQIVCGISEHHLREYKSNFLNTIDPNYMAFTTSAIERDPSVYRFINKGGISLLIRKSLSSVLIQYLSKEIELLA